MKIPGLNSLLFYVIGFSITAFIYYSADNHYAHGPNLYHLTFLLTILIGIFWFSISLIQYLKNGNGKLNGNLIIHGIVLISTLVYLWILFEHDPVSEVPSIEDEIYVARTGDSTLIFHNSNMIYLEISDSIHLDLRDSTLKSIELD